MSARSSADQTFLGYETDKFSKLFRIWSGTIGWRFYGKMWHQTLLLQKNQNLKMAETLMLRGTLKGNAYRD